MTRQALLGLEFEVSIVTCVTPRSAISTYLPFVLPVYMYKYTRYDKHLVWYKAVVETSLLLLQRGLRRDGLTPDLAPRMPVVPRM